MNENEQIQEMARTICGLNTDKGCFCDGGYCNYNCLAYEKAKALYSKDYRKVERGEWIPYGMNMTGTVGNWKCSACNKTSLSPSDFCGRCGADMRGEKD